MATPNRKLLMQSPNDPARWEALEVLANDPTNFYRTELDTAGAERYRNAGGFEIVPPQRYNEELGAVSEAVRKKREPQPMGRMGSEMDAGTVARFNEAMGRPGMGPETITAMGQDEAALAGRSLVERPMPMNPELAARIARERARDLADGSRSAPAPRNREPLPGTSRNQRNRPAISVGKPGAAGNLRPVADLRPPAAPPEPAPEAVATRETPAPTGDAEYAAAQERAQSNRLGATFGRAGETIASSISGRKADTSFYDNLESGADDPVRALLAQREADRRKALQDPTSEPSQRLQQAVAKAMPGVYTPEELAQITAEDERMVTQYGAMRQRLEERKLDLSRQQQQQADAIAREDFVREDEQANQRALARMRGGGGSAAADRQAQRDAERAEQQTRQFADDVTKTGAPAFYSQYSAAKDIMDRNPGDLPGFGQLAGRLPDAVTSKDGVALRQAIGQMLASYRNDITGAGMSNTERAEFGQITGLLQSGDEDSVRQGVERLRQAVDARLQAAAGGYRPDVVQEYGRRVPAIGSALQRGQGQQPQGTAAGKVEMIAPDGTPGLVDAAEVAEAEANGYRRKA